MPSHKTGACTMLISAGLSSNDFSMSTIGPVRMLSVVGAKNSRSDLLAMASNSGVKLEICLVDLSTQKVEPQAEMMMMLLLWLELSLAWLSSF
jgi:hypothetical protein